MKVRSLLLSAVCLLATGMLTASCSDDENEEWKDEGLQNNLA